MLRRTVLLLLFAAFVPVEAADRDGFPPAGTVTVVGRVGRISSTATVRVLEERVDAFPELLAETEVGPGPFRVSVPTPERLFRLVGTADGRLLYGDGIRPPNSVYRASDPLEALGNTVHRVRVGDDQGRPVPGARVVRTLGLPGWEGSTAISFLTEEFVADEEGIAVVPVPAGTPGTLTAFAGGRRSRLRPFGPDQPAVVSLVLPARTRLLLALDPGRSRVESPADARSVTVSALVDGAWTAVERQGGGHRGWEGWLAPGVTAIRVAHPGGGVVEVRDEQLTAERLVTLDVALSRRPLTGLEVRVVPPDGHPPVLRPGRGSDIGPPAPDPWQADGRLAGKEAWNSRGPIRGVTFCRVGPLRDNNAEPGRYEVRARGWLFVPVVREVEVEEGVFTVVRLHPESGGGIHLVVRGRGGRPVTTVSFSVLDGAGAEAEFLYTESHLWFPAWFHEGPVVTDVPNGGLVQLPPGRYRLLLRGEDGTISTHEVRVYAGIITRLDVSRPHSGRSGSGRLR